MSQTPHERSCAWRNHMKRVLFVIAAATLTACTSPPPSSSTSAAGTAATSSATTITATSKSPEALEHFRKGEALLDNLRTTEAAEEFNQALKLDPDFVLGHVYHGLTTP